MRVLFVTGLSAFATGGVQTETIRLVGGMADRGVDVGYCGDRLPDPPRDRPAGRPAVPFFALDYPPEDAAGGQVRAAVRGFAPDVIHVVGGGLRLLRQVDAVAAAAGVPWVFTCHNVPPFERITSRLLGNARVHYAARNLAVLPAVLGWKRFLRRGRFARVIAHSGVVAGHVARYGCEATRLVTIPFGCDPPAPAIAPPADPSPAAVSPVAASLVNLSPAGASPFPTDAYPKILTVAGYAFHKGQQDYVAAVGRLVGQYPKLAYRMIGNSRNAAYLAFLHRRIERAGLTGHVEILRNAAEPVRRAALAAADVYAQPSHEEGYCLAFAEAAMVAPRLVGCRTGEMPGLAGADPTARIVAPGDPAGLADATAALLDMAVTPAHVSGRVRRLLADYSWATYLDRHQSVYDGLANRF